SSYGPLPVPYALDTILDEFSLEPMVFTHGAAVAVAPMSGKESIEFPPPVGRMEALFTLHSEVAMFPRSFPELQESSFKVAFPPAFTQKVAFLVELGFASREKQIRDVSPREMLIALATSQKTEESEPRDCDALRVHVKGAQNGKVVSRTAESVILPHPAWKIAAGSLDTGVPLSIVAQMLARKQIVEPGVLCPERCVPPQNFFDELIRRGITVTFF
ncbi:MAG TPA: saccharopine dehydrogenase C-terminal domain-containing protein, partial [Acidobacteriota bacterium]